MWRLGTSAIVLAALLAVCLVARSALAAPAVEPSGAPPPEAGPDGAEQDGVTDAEKADAEETDAEKTDAKKKARQHFEIGVELMNDQAWDPALAEFLASRRAFPTRSATKNAALCYRHLHRYAEALDMFEKLLQEFPDLPERDRLGTERAIRALQRLVGTIELRGAPPGARVQVDSKYWGTIPLAEPIRVGIGTHTVRVYRSGYLPFETRVAVASEPLVVFVELDTLVQRGRLRVEEQAGKRLEVLVDGTVVGTTPWEGPVGEGQHAVLLRGDDVWGTEPVAVEVSASRPKVLALRAVVLESALRVVPEPAEASIYVNSVPVGRGIWQGRLRPGPHVVEARAEGYLPRRRETTVERGQSQTLEIRMRRAAVEAVPKRAAGFRLEVDGRLAIVPSLGGDLADSCGSGCEGGVGLGGLAVLHGVYRLESGLGLGLAAGYLGVFQRTIDRTVTLLPEGKPANAGLAEDALFLSGATIGASVSYWLGEELPLTFRLGTGVLAGRLRDERNGSFHSSAGTPYRAETLTDLPLAAYLYLAPEVRFGVAMAERFELTFGVTTYVLLGLDVPEWSHRGTVMAAEDGPATYPSETVAGDVLALIAPGIGGAYWF